MCIGTTKGGGHCKFPPTCHFGGGTLVFPRLFLGEPSRYVSGWDSERVLVGPTPHLSQQVLRPWIISRARWTTSVWRETISWKKGDDICWRWDPMVTLVPEIVNKNSLLSMTTFVVLLLSTQRLSLSNPGNLGNLWNLWLICKIIQIDSIVSAICHQEISLLRDANGTRPHLVVWDLENRLASLSIPCYDFPI